MLIQRKLYLKQREFRGSMIQFYSTQFPVLGHAQIFFH